MEITQIDLMQLLLYESENGVFTWKVNRGGKAKAGNLAGSPDGDGYIKIMVKGKFSLAHRLAWLYVYGKFPINCIDHINGVRNDNRILNLREATLSENQQNRCHKNGLTGTSWNKKIGKWRATIKKNGKQHSLGYFINQADAHAAYLTAKSEIHNFQPIPREKL